MVMEFLLVTYPEEAVVLADDKSVGVTNHTLLLPADEYKITLKSTQTVPASQDVVLTGTSVMRPRVVSFAAA